MTRPAENQARGEAPTVAQLQQTVEALERHIDFCDHMSDETRDVLRAALRDLVAQAELAADARGPISEALELIARLYRNPNEVPYGERLDVDQKLRSLLARLDGAR